MKKGKIRTLETNWYGEKVIKYRPIFLRPLSPSARVKFSSYTNSKLLSTGGGWEGQASLI
jgi:hypothetical protein